MSEEEWQKFNEMGLNWLLESEIAQSSSSTLFGLRLAKMKFRED